MAAWSDFSFEMTRGDDHTEPFIVEGGDPLAGIDISGYQEVWFTARRFPGDTAAVFQLKKTSGDIAFTTTGTDGKLLVTIPHTATSPLPNYQQTIFAELQIKDGAGKIDTTAQGVILLRPELETATS